MFNGGKKVMEKVENFYTEYEDMFEEYIEDIKGVSKTKISS